MPPLASPAALPIIPEVVASCRATDTTAVKWLYMLRLLRLARVFRLLKVRLWGRSRRVPQDACSQAPALPAPPACAALPCRRPPPPPWANARSRLPQVWGGLVWSSLLARFLQRFLSTSAVYLCNLMLALTMLLNLASARWRRTRPPSARA